LDFWIAVVINNVFVAITWWANSAALTLFRSAISVRHFSVHEIDDIFGRAKGGQ